MKNALCLAVLLLGVASVAQGACPPMDRSALGGPFGATMMGRPERVPPPKQHVPIPNGSLETVRITMERTQCYGTCPAYAVEIKGDGAATYDGRAHVVVPGEHKFTVAADSVKCLLDAFRDADFWSLAPIYRANITDLPTTTLTLEIGGEKKTLEDYAGEMVGMPSKITVLEQMVDAVASRPWVAGDETTVSRLSAEGFDFRTPEAADLLAEAASQKNPDFALALLRAGTAPNGHASSYSGSVPAVVTATAAGHLQLVRALIAAGAFSSGSSSVKEEALRAAARSGDPAIVQEVLLHKPDVNGRDVEGSTALMMVRGEVEIGPRGAVIEDRTGERVAIVRALLAAGADATLRDSEDSSAALETKSVEEVALLAAAGVPLNRPSIYGLTPLLNTMRPEVALAMIKAGAEPWVVDDSGGDLLKKAREKRWPTVLAYLRDHPRPKTVASPKWPPDVAALSAKGFDFKSRAGAVMLIRAVEEGNDPLARALLAAGAPTNQLYSNDRGQHASAASAAAAAGKIDILRALIAAGAFVDAPYKAREAALMAAAAHSRPESVAELLKTGVSVNASDSEGHVALAEVGSVLPRGKDDENAWRKSSEDTVALLLSAGADPRLGGAGTTPLHRANSVKWVQLLLSAGADVEALDAGENTPLMSVWASKDDIAAALLAAGANPNHANGAGETPLHAANSAQRVEALLKAGAKLESRDGGGRTPLLAAQNDEAALAIAKAGADLKAVDAEGYNALDYALDKERPKAAAYLAAQGLKPTHAH